MANNESPKKPARKMGSKKTSEERVEPDGELAVCDIIGSWGGYQWSLALFATIYSAIFSITVVTGPIWTPDLKHQCSPANMSDFARDVHQCQWNQTDSIVNQTLNVTCTSYVYESTGYGEVVTNTFNLVCEQKWLRSLISSSALAGMLLSSVTLGLLSDKYGRAACVKAGMLLAILATIGAYLARDYFLLNVCILIMSFGQVGAANALCTLVMEATTPKWRFVAVFEYGLGWGAGMFLAPILHSFTLSYKHSLLTLLAGQLILLLWFRWGIFESIRWLLSEGQINRAQIELRRACRLNRVKNGAELACKIALVQEQQMRKASSVIEQVAAPKMLAAAQQKEVEQATQELGALRSAIRRSFAIKSPEEQPAGLDMLNNLNRSASFTLDTMLSPTLSRKSFSLAIGPADEKTVEMVESDKNSMKEADNESPRQSITTQALMQLALKYSKTLEEQEEGGCFIVKLFHRKLYKLTIVLMLISVMLETSYYGLIQTNKFVGSDVALNYMVGACGEWLAAILFMIVLWAFSRRVALIAPIIISAFVCLGLALSYQLIPDQSSDQLEGGHTNTNMTNTTNEFVDDLDAALLTDQMDTPFFFASILPGYLQNASHEQLIEVRESINFWLITIGKTSVTVAIQITATIGMEAYPNNLRQTGSGVIVLVGRMGSIASPFLFNDSSPDRHVFKFTLLALAILAFIVSLLVPFFVRNTKDKDLCDKLNDIEDN